MTNPKKYYSLPEVAALTGRFRAQVYRDVKNGKLKAKTIQVPRYVVSQSELETYAGGLDK